MASKTIRELTANNDPASTRLIISQDPVSGEITRSTLAQALGKAVYQPVGVPTPAEVPLNDAITRLVSTDEPGYLPVSERLTLSVESGTPPLYILGIVHGQAVGADASGNLRLSSDGENYGPIVLTAGSPFTPAVAIGRVAELNDGEVIAFGLVSGSGRELWKSSGWQTNPATASWTKVLEAETYASGQSRFHEGWGLRVQGQYVFAIEYGAKPGAHKAYLSTDHGSTFAEVWDQRDQFTNINDTDSNAHMHGCCIDIWHDTTPRLWVHSSDGPYQRLFWSDDLGDNWTPIPDQNYDIHTAVADIAAPGAAGDIMPPNYVVLDATPWGISIGSDAKPEGTAIIPRDDFYAASPRVQSAALIFRQFGYNGTADQLQYVAQNSVVDGDWTYHLHAPSGAVITANVPAVPPVITVTHTPSGIGGIVWEGSTTEASNFKRLLKFNGYFWMTDLANNEMIRFPLSQQTAAAKHLRPSGDRSGILGGMTSGDNRDLAVHNSARSTGLGGSIAVGATSIASSTEAVAIGRAAQATGAVSVAIGGRWLTNPTVAAGDRSVAIGARASSPNQQSVAIGDTALSSGVGSVVVGRNSSTSNNNSIALGSTAITTSFVGIAIGENASAGNRGIAMGISAATTGTSAIAIGRDASAAGEGSIALGRDSAATLDSEMNIGVRDLRMASFAADRTAPVAGQVAFYLFDNGVDPAEVRVRFPSGRVKTLAVDAD